MTQSSGLIETLKRVLKQRGVTYAAVARELNMSEANVKRLFASKRFSVARLEEVCRLLQMDLTDLVALYEESRQRVVHLTMAQEQELVRDVKLLLVAVSVRNRFNFDDILAHYQISSSECVRCLAKLDKLKLIDLLPGNRIKLRIGDDFRWLPGGPIERFFERQIQGPFMKSSFEGEQETRLFLFGVLSEPSRQAILCRLHGMAQEFSELLRRDAQLPLSGRKNVGFLLAFRPWDVELFTPLRRKRG